MVRRAFTLSAASLLAAATLFAQPGPGMGSGHAPEGTPEPRHPRMGRMMEGLKLTEAQELQMQKLRLEFAKSQSATKAKITAARLDIAGILLADAPDRAAIEKGLKVISDLQHQQKLNLVDHLFAVRGILTPEQQKMWKKHLAEALRDGGPMGGRMARPRHERFRGGQDDGE